MLNCKEATRLMSEAQDRKLAVSERVQLEFHLVLCKGCQNFQDQMAFLRKACRAYMDRREKITDEAEKR